MPTTVTGMRTDAHARDADGRFEKVRPVRAHEQIVEQLERRILGGVLPVGSRLPSERVMMTEFHVSRPTVREALRVAESLGLVTVRQGDPGGPVVRAHLSSGIARVIDGMLQSERTSAAELLEIRIVLDSTAAVLASARPAAEVESIAEACRLVSEATDELEFVRLDAEFHHSIAVASGNRLLPLLLQSLEGPLEGLSPEWEGHSREITLAQHRTILDAIRSGDGAAACQAARQHLYDSYTPALSAAEVHRIDSLLAQGRR